MSNMEQVHDLIDEVVRECFLIIREEGDHTLRAETIIEKMQDLRTKITTSDAGNLVNL